MRHFWFQYSFWRCQSNQEKFKPRETANRSKKTGKNSAFKVVGSIWVRWTGLEESLTQTITPVKMWNTLQIYSGNLHVVYDSQQLHDLRKFKTSDLYSTRVVQYDWIISRDHRCRFQFTDCARNDVSIPSLIFLTEPKRIPARRSEGPRVEVIIEKPSAKSSDQILQGRSRSMYVAIDSEDSS